MKFVVKKNTEGTVKTTRGSSLFAEATPRKQSSQASLTEIQIVSLELGADVSGFMKMLLVTHERVWKATHRSSGDGELYESRFPRRQDAGIPAEEC